MPATPCDLGLLHITLIYTFTLKRYYITCYTCYGCLPQPLGNTIWGGCARMRHVTWVRNRNNLYIIIWNLQPSFANFYGAPVTIKVSFYVSMNIPVTVLNKQTRGTGIVGGCEDIFTDFDRKTFAKVAHCSTFVNVQVTATCLRYLTAARSSVSSTRCWEFRWRWSCSQRLSSVSWSSRPSCTTLCSPASATRSASSTCDSLTSSSSSASCWSSSFSFHQPSSPSLKPTGTSSTLSTTASCPWRPSDLVTTSQETSYCSRTDRSIRSLLHVSNTYLPYSIITFARAHGGNNLQCSLLVICPAT